MSRILVSNIKVNRDNIEDEFSIKKIDNWIFKIFIIGIIFIPLVIGAKSILFVSPIISGTSILQTGNQMDFFTYYKFIILILLTIVALSLFMYKILFLNYQIKLSIITSSIYILIASFATSTVFSDYKTIALFGLYNRHDGSLTFICYGILILIALNITYPKNTLKPIIFSMYPFIWINVVISTMTFYGKNILLNPIINKLFTFSLPEGMTISEESFLTGTLNQWNYMSGYSAVMATIFLTVALFNKNLSSSVFHLLTAVAAFTTILISVSTSGFITMMIIFILLTILIVKDKNYKRTIPIFTIFILFSSISLTVLSNHNPKVWTESIGFFTEKNPFIEAVPVAQEINIKNIFGSKVSASSTELVLPVLPERSYSAGSGRLYIWNNVFSLIVERPLTGYGMDTITYEFPQYDINKRAGMYDENIIIDKPHNFYIALLYGVGIFGFVSFIVIVSFFMLTIGKRIIKKDSQPISIAIFLGCLAFFIQAMFNDSVIGATFVPLLTIAILYKVTNGREEETS